MTGGANRERVLNAIAEPLAHADGQPAGDVDPDVILRSLEGYGYAVVREGQVPTPGVFAQAAERLTGISELLNERDQFVRPSPGEKAELAAGLLTEFRQLACLVLDIDEEDIDEGPDL